MRHNTCLVCVLVQLTAVISLCSTGEEISRDWRNRLVMRSDAMSSISNIIQFNVISLFLQNVVFPQHSRSSVASKPTGLLIQTASLRGSTRAVYVFSAWCLMAGLKETVLIYL